MKPYPKLHLFVKKIHKRCVQFSKSPQARSMDFHDDPALGCMCAVASYYLMHEMIDSGEFKPSDIKFIEGVWSNPKWAPKRPFSDADINHCWIEFRGIILDITVAQFAGMDTPLVITTSTELYKNYHIHKTFKHSETPRIKRRQKSWGKGQTILECLPNKINRALCGD